MVKWEPQKRIMRDRLRNERSRTASFLVSCKVAVAGEARDRESWGVEREARIGRDDSRRRADLDLGVSPSCLQERTEA